MSVQDLLIHFKYFDDDYENTSHSREFYIPGEEMRGIVSLHLRSSQRIRGLTIHFLGTATVSWEATNKKRVYQASEIHLEFAKPLLDIGYDNSIDLQGGLHQFGFKYQLPSDIPSTFNGIYGQVTYLAKVKVDCEDERNTTITSEPFMVLRRPELPLELYNEKKMKKSRLFVGLHSGKVKVQCVIDKCAAVPGDNIIIDGDISNWTGKEISLIQASLILESHFYAEGHEIVFRQYLSKRDDVYDVNIRHGRRWRHVLLPVPPYLPDSGLEQCKIISIKYLFQFKVRIEGKEDVIVETPLFVGRHSPQFGPNGRDMMGKMWSGFSTADDDPSSRDLPWYGGKSTYTESVNGDIFDLK
uniref:Arrestin C-terminal-like domain-containing protein n=1 Tax=Arion vulgaris TaxID=1028688 RepID=A0A0B7A003_9EUPU